jgi:tetratricopeptide (TPR) repeat protein
MHIIRISEQRQESDGTFHVSVAFGDNGHCDATVTNPTGTAEEENLTWYFEEHLRYPFLESERERDAVQQIAEYGTALFSQVFEGASSQHYLRLRAQNFDDCRLEISGSTALQQLHWEALRDPSMDRPLALCLPITRYVPPRQSAFDLVSDSPTLNILLVVARPGGSDDIAYRTISRPLLDALAMTDMPVTVDLVRPGTWTALNAHMQASTNRHGPGWYQVVHFDLHGLFSEYKLLEAGRLARWMHFSSDALDAFQGRRGFLFFETGHDGIGEPVAAEKVASLLVRNGVQLAVLNACKSAMQSSSEVSLAQRLSEAGVPVTLGMAYSVTISAAVRAMPLLYRHLTNRMNIGAALTAVRRDLYDHRARSAYFNQEIDLQDWLLPVMFAKEPFEVKLRKMTSEEEVTFHSHLAQVGEEPVSEYGFMGGDLAIQAIEGRLLTSEASNEALIQGFAGSGKSALLAHLAWWWQRTGLVERVFRFTYENHALTCSEIIEIISSSIMSHAEYVQVSVMPFAAQLEKLVQWLRTTRHLLILDNVESLPLESEELGRIRALLAGLRGGRTLVLLGSRRLEKWFTDYLDLDTYILGGLDAQATSALVERILHNHGANQYLDDDNERDALQDLVALLGNYPGPLKEVLRALVNSSPTRVLTEIAEGNVRVVQAGPMERAIEYSYHKLSPAIQNSLLLLAPFTSVISTNGILARYQKFLSSAKALRVLGTVDLASALEHAIDEGLAIDYPDRELANIVQLHPILPLFLRNLLHDRQDVLAAASEARYRTCSDLAFTFLDIIESEDKQRQQYVLAATKAWYNDLISVVDYGLRTGQSIIILIMLLDYYLDKTHQQDTRIRVIEKTISDHQSSTSDLDVYEFASLYFHAGTASLDQGRFDDAKGHYEMALQFQQRLGEDYHEAKIHHQLGIVAFEQRRFADAEISYRNALDLRLGSGDEGGIAATYHELGVVAQEMRRFDEAEANYHKALDLKLRSDDYWSSASTYHQLGAIASLLQRYGEAETNLRKALGFRLQFGDRAGAASSYLMLGNVASAQQRNKDAETFYRKALDIYLDLGIQSNAAKVFHQLGVAAAAQGHHDDAATYYNKAVHLYSEPNNLDSAHAYNNLGTLARDRGLLAQAEANYLKALDIRLRHGDLLSVAQTYLLLGGITVDQYRYSHAEAYYRKALEIELKLDGSDRADTYLQLGLLAQRQERHVEAEANYRKALEQLPDDARAGNCYNNLGVLAEMQGLYQEAESNYRKAVQLLLRFDLESALSATRMLSNVIALQSRYVDASIVLIKAVSMWRIENGEWPSEDLQWLYQQRSRVGAEFALLVNANVPKALIDEFNSAISAEVENVGSEAVGNLIMAWLHMPTRDESEAFLKENRTELVCDLGSASLAELQSSNPNQVLELHAYLLAECRRDGITAAYSKYRALTGSGGILPTWLGISDWEASAAYLAEHATDLSDPFCLIQLAGLCEEFQQFWINMGLLLMGDDASEGYAAIGTIDINPFRRAEALIINGDLRHALAWACLARARDDGLGALLMGRVYVMQREPDRAAAALATATLNVPIPHLVQILTTYEQLLELQADNASWYSDYARALQQAGRHEDALAAYDRAIALSPADVSARLNKAHVLFYLGEFEEATPELLNALRLRPEDALVSHLLLGSVALQADYEVASEHFAAALTAPGKLLTPFSRAFWRSLALTGLGHLDEGLAELSSAIPARLASESIFDEWDVRLFEAFRSLGLVGVDAVQQLLEESAAESQQSDLKLLFFSIAPKANFRGVLFFDSQC